MPLSQWLRGIVSFMLYKEYACTAFQDHAVRCIVYRLFFPQLRKEDDNEVKRMKLYHTGKTEIREPDINRGRKNADFGPGFYLTPDMDFAYRWAGANAIANEYELDEEGLKIHRFHRDEDWFNYIFHNRRAVDSLNADVVIGPEYTQVALKTKKAVQQLRWLRAEKITRLDETQRKAEQAAYDADFARVLNEITEVE